MVLKNLIIFLVLLWIMPQFMAKTGITSKFRKTQQVSYRQEDEIVDTPPSYASLECSVYKTHTDGEIELLRCKRDMGIQYRHERKEDKKRVHPKTSCKAQIWHSIPTSRYVTAKNYIADIYTPM